MGARLGRWAVLGGAVLALCAARADARREFADAFDADISSKTWRCETLRGRRWRVEAGELVSQPVVDRKGLGDPGNVLLDVVTRRKDFQDFELLCDIRFDTQGSHKDHRVIYFRTAEAGAAEPVGYEVHIAVWLPFPDPGHYLKFRRRNADGSVTSLTPFVEYPWVLERWYRVRLAAAGHKFNLKIWPREENEPDAWTLTASDPAALYEKGGVGFGNYWGAVTRVDNVRVIPLDGGPRP